MGDYITAIITPDLSIHFYEDGIGLIVFYDSIKIYDKVSQVNIDELLNDRKTAHCSILLNKHPKTEVINNYINAAKSIVKKNKRRYTSYDNWEYNGLSYIMSFYFIDYDFKLIKKKDINKFYNLLYTDNHNTLNCMNNVIKDKILEELETSVDVLSNTHVLVSWANVLIFGKIDNVLFNEYIEFEKKIQHIWMYVYITDKNIDFLIDNLSQKKASSRHIDTLHKNLLDMKLKLDKYSGVVSSTMHERDFRILKSLEESSKLDIMINGVVQKYELLEGRLNWIVNEKRFHSNKKIEFFLFISTVLSTFSIIKVFQISDISNYWYFFIITIILILLLFNPIKK